MGNQLIIHEARHAHKHTHTHPHTLWSTRALKREYLRWKPALNCCCCSCCCYCCYCCCAFQGRANSTLDLVFNHAKAKRDKRQKRQGLRLNCNFWKHFKWHSDYEGLSVLLRFTCPSLCSDATTPSPLLYFKVSPDLALVNVFNQLRKLCDINPSNIHQNIHKSIHCVDPIRQIAFIIV